MPLSESQFFIQLPIELPIILPIVLPIVLPTARNGQKAQAGSGLAPGPTHHPL